MKKLKIGLLQISPCDSLDGNLKKGLDFCKKAKKKSLMSFEKIDAILTRYYEMKLFSIMEIDSFEKDYLVIIIKEYDAVKNTDLSLYYRMGKLDIYKSDFVLHLNLFSVPFSKRLMFEWCFKITTRAKNMAR